MNLMSLTPGIVDSVTMVDRERREIRVRIPGLTDGAEEFPVAWLMNPLGDKSEHTEIRILEGDRVWLAFENGDSRFPIIMGYRPKQVDNVVEFRRWHSENIESDADETQKHTAGTNYTVQAGEKHRVEAGENAEVEAAESVLLNAGANIEGEAAEEIKLTAGSKLTLTVGGSSIEITGSGVKITGARIDLN